MLPSLELELCDIWGNPIAGARLDDALEKSVEIPVGEQRLANFTLHIEDIASAYINPRTTLLRAWYSYLADPIFTGAIFTPQYQPNTGTVTFTALDGWRRLEGAYLRDPMVLTARPIQYAMWDLVVRAAARARPVGAPPLGILQGAMDTADYGLLDRELIIGTNTADQLREFQSYSGAPDIQLKPRASTAGEHWTFNALYGALGGQGVDKSDVAKLEYGFGKNNCAEFTWSPDAVPSRTRYTVQGRPPDGSEIAPLSTAYWAAEELAGYIDEGWEGVDTEYQQILDARALEQVDAYGQPLDTIGITPAPESDAQDPLLNEFGQMGKAPRYGVDYLEGDRVEATGRKGNMRKTLITRVRRVTLEQRGKDGATSKLLVVPTVERGNAELM